MSCLMTKPTKWHFRPAKTQISLGIRPDWSVPSLSVWRTRSTVLDLLHIPRSHSAYFDRTFSVQGPKLWNSLPSDIRNSTSINTFKCELKRYLLYNNQNALKFCCISNWSSATVRCGGGGCVWTKARSTLALPVWHCRRTLKSLLEQNYLFVWDSCFLRLFMGVNNKNIVHSKSGFP